MASTRKLRFGLLNDFRNPLKWERPFKDVYAEIIEMIAWAETIGYDDVWLSEHHFSEDGYGPSPIVQAAAIAVKTKKIRIGLSVLLLPLYHPVRLAEDAATVDILSGGRFELGAGLGYRPEEFAGHGISLKDRGGRANEALEIIRRLWEGETVTFKGKHFQIENARLSPLPVQRPRPPIWVGGFSRPAARRAARLGDGLVGIGDMRELYKWYLEELRAAGKDPSQAKVGGGPWWVIVSNDPEKTWHEVAPHLVYQLTLYSKWLGSTGQNVFAPVNDLASLKASGIVNVVLPEDAVKIIKDFVAEVPVERFYTLSLPVGFPPKKMYEHLELFATKVMPHFR